MIPCAPNPTDFLDDDDDGPCRTPQSDGRGFCRHCGHILHAPGELPVARPLSEPRQ